MRAHIMIRNKLEETEWEQEMRAVFRQQEREWKEKDAGGIQQMELKLAPRSALIAHERVG